MKRLLLLLAVLSGAIWAQPQKIISVTFSDPTGLACQPGTAVIYATTGGFFTCQSSVWAAVSGGGGTPAGSSGQVQWNNGAGAFGADSGLAYNSTTKALGVIGTIYTGQAGVGSGSVVFIGGTSGNVPVAVDATGTTLTVTGILAASSFTTTATAFSASGAEQTLAAACPGTQAYDKLFYSSANHIPQFCLASGTTVVATTVVPAAAATANEFVDNIAVDGTQHKRVIAAADLPTVTVAYGGTGLTTLTAHAVQVGAATSTPAQVGPDASTTKVLISAGSSADPAFGSITTALLPTVALTRTACFDFGADNAASDLVDADIGPQGNIFKLPVAATIIEATVSANAGTPKMPILQKNHWGGASWAAVDITSNVLVTGAAGIETCAATGAACASGVAKDGTVTIVTAGSANVVAAGDWIQTKTGSGFASATAKRLSICLTYTVN